MIWVPKHGSGRTAAAADRALTLVKVIMEEMGGWTRDAKVVDTREITARQENVEVTTSVVTTMPIKMADRAESTETET